VEEIFSIEKNVVFYAYTASALQYTFFVCESKNRKGVVSMRFMGKKTKKVLTLFLAVTIVGLYTFGDVAAIFAGDVNSEAATSSKTTSESTQNPSQANSTDNSADNSTNVQNNAKTDTSSTVSYPEQQFKESVSGTQVKVVAPKGAFPAGTKMTVTAVKSSKVKKAVSKAAGKTVTHIQAFDITFTDKGGNKVEPKKEVKVSFSGVDLKGNKGLNVYHMNKSNTSAEKVAKSKSSTSAVFGADSFSIYVITDGNPVLKTYKFFNEAGTVISEQTVKTGDKLVEPETPSKDGYKFLGWTATKGSTNYFTAFGTQTVTDSTEVDLYPAFQQAYYVYFMDGTGDDARVIYTKEGMTNDVIDDSGVIVPLASSYAVTGWYKDKALTQEVSSVTLTNSNITLYPKVEAGHYLTFNGNGGSYTEPEFVTANGTTVAPTVPTRHGYTFQYWADSNNNQFTFGTGLLADTTLHAVWKAKTDTQYTVMHWQENANDSNYSLKETETLTGTSGSQTAAKAKTYAGFTAKTFTQIEIKGDGSTIVNIYYQRQTYSVKFYQNTGYYVEPQYRGDTGYWTGTWYELTDLTITAKYGANISDKWPKSTAQNWLVTPNGSTYQSGISTMPLNGAKFYYKKQAGNKVMNLYYYTEVLAGTQGTSTYDGKSYVLHHTDSFNTDNSDWTTTKEDHYDIAGFTYTGNTPDGSKFSRVSYSSTYYVTFYYTRNNYDIKFVNGGSVEKTKTYQYQADISSAGYTPERPANIPEGYVFQGWYDNEKCAGGAYVFDGATMPAGSVTLYAKWAAPTYTATAHLSLDGNGTKTIDIAYGSKIDQNDMPTVVDSTGKVISQGDDTYKVTVPEGYKWIGWTTKDSNGDYKLYNFDTETYKDLELYPYYINEAKYNVTYNANGGSGTAPSDLMKYASGSYAEVASGITLTAPAGKVFLNWNTAADGSGKAYYPKDKVHISGNVTLYAQYGDADSLISLTYHANYPSDVTATGNTVNTVSAVKNNSSVVVAGNSFNEASSDYNFEGWNTKADGSGAGYAPNATINIDNNGSNDLYAVWSKKPALDIVITGNHANSKYNGSTQGITGYTISDLPSGVTVSLKDGSTAVASGTNVGTYQMNLTKSDFTVSGADRYKVSMTVNDGSLEITKRAVTMTSATASKEFDGTALTNNNVAVTGDGFAAGEGAAYDVTGSQKYVGNSSNTFTYTLNAGTLADNYTITKAEGTLTVTNKTAKYEITVRANNGSKTYDGQAMTVSGLQETKFTVNGQEYTVSGLTATATATNAGTYPVNVTGTAVVKDADGVDVTSQFAVKTVNGSLEITPAPLEIIVSGNSTQLKYNGKEQNVTGYNVKSVLPEGVSVTMKDGAKAEAKGTNVGQYNMNLTADEFEAIGAGNYKITWIVADGSLTIVKGDDNNNNNHHKGGGDNDNPGHHNSSGPRTGDSSDLMTQLMILALASSGLGAAAFMRRREQREE
jgi:uncharacterized repeat protein (TIGR02543 family)